MSAKFRPSFRPKCVQAVSDLFCFKVIAVTFVQMSTVSSGDTRPIHVSDIIFHTEWIEVSVEHSRFHEIYIT